MRAEMYCYWQVFGRCALILVKPTIRGSSVQAVRREELPDRTWYHETSVCVDEGSGSSLERLGSKYMNKKENLQSERDRERGGGVPPRDRRRAAKHTHHGKSSLAPERARDSVG